MRLMVVDVITNIKSNIINDFTNFVKRLNVGYVDKYDNILHKIMFVQTYQYLDKIDPIYEYLINLSTPKVREILDIPKSIVDIERIKYQLKGDKGDKGDPGLDGVDGLNGKSLYELMVDAGKFTGTLEEFLEYYTKIKNNFPLLESLQELEKEKLVTDSVYNIIYNNPFLSQDERGTLHGYKNIYDLSYSTLYNKIVELSVNSDISEENKELLISLYLDYSKKYVDYITAQEGINYNLINKVNQRVSNLENGSNCVFRIIEEDVYNSLPTPEKDVLYFITETIDYILTEIPSDLIILKDGLNHTIIATDAYTVIGTGGINTGIYSFELSLNFGYKWSDGTLSNKTVTYTIIENTTWVFGSTFPITFNN